MSGAPGPDPAPSHGAGPARVLIAGCGYLGAALAARLAARGDRVFALRRSAAPAPPGATPLQADLAEPASLRALPADLDAVVYAASAGARTPEAYARAYVAGPANLAAALARSSPGLRRFWLVSSTRVYAQQHGEWVDEESETRPAGFAGRLLLDGEQRLGQTGLPVSVLRLAGIYGPGRGGLLERVRRGEAAIRPGPPRYTNRIHRDDAAALLAFGLALPAPPARLLGVDSDPAPEAEVLRHLAARLGAPEPPLREPEPGSRSAEANRRCSNRRALGLGFRFAFPSYRDGYAALLADAR